MNEGAILSHDWFPRALPANVRLGDRSWCYSSFAYLHCRSRRPYAVSVGHDSGIYHGTFFELGPEGEVEIGEYCTLVGAIICTNQRVVIGDFVFLAHEVVIADSSAAKPFAESGTVVETRFTEVKTGIVIGNNVWIGARSVVLSGARIGEGAIVGAAAVVDCEVPPFAIFAGNPGHIVGWAGPGSTAGRPARSQQLTTPE